MWVGLLGTKDFDITQVDSSTVMLSRADGVGEAISPQGNPRFKDVATPFEGKLCDCHTAGKDGILDLRAKFKTADMEAAFGFDAEPTGTVIELTLTGALLDGTPFQANDCITIDR